MAPRDARFGTRRVTKHRVNTARNDCICSWSVLSKSIVSESNPSSPQSTPSLDSSPNADLLEQLKKQLPDALFAQVSGRLNAYANEAAYSKLKIQVLEERLRLQRIEKYGPGSEKLSSLQLELLEQEPGVSSEEVAAES